MDKEQYLLKASDLVVRFKQSNGLRQVMIRPVNHISFSIQSQEIVGIVGESGSGKTTLGRALVGMVPVYKGTLSFKGRNVTRLHARGLRQYWTEVQMIFQDVYNSLNPVFTVEQQLLFPIRRHMSNHSEDPQQELDRLLRLTGLTPTATVRDKLPHELSGGQRQRVAVVRSLAIHPQLLVADEPVSMLDVSLRADILKLLLNLRDEFHLSIVYITHDLPSATYVCDRILVMYGGRVIETGDAQEIVMHPQHPYTQRLLASATFQTLPETSVRTTDEQVKSVLQESYQGCPYASMCPLAMDICAKEQSDFIQITPHHEVACHAVSRSEVEATS